MTSTVDRRVPISVYFFGALAELLFGYDTGVIGVALLSIKKDFSFGPQLQGFIVSSLLLGAAGGVGVAGLLADRFGRRRLIIATGLVFIVGGLLSATAPNVGVLVLGRVVMGLAVGASAVVVSVYLAEVAPTSSRGKITGLGQLMVVSGILIAYIVDYSLSSSDAWRWMLGVSIIPAVVLATGMVAMPETPRWLVTRGRLDAARDSLRRLHAADPERELHEISTTLLSESATRRTGAALWRALAAPRLRRSVIGAASIAILVQFIGTNSILYYAPTTLIHAGFAEHAAITANISVGVANVLFTLLGLAVVDKVRRRQLLSVGVIGMGASMVVLAIISATTSASTSQAWLTLVFLVVFLAFFACTWGVCVRIVVAELFPASIRGSAAGIVLVLNWLANFVVGQWFPTLLATSATAAFALFAGVAVIALLFVRLVLPETSGRSLEDLEVHGGWQSPNSGSPRGANPASV